VGRPTGPGRGRRSGDGRRRGRGRWALAAAVAAAVAAAGCSGTAGDGSGPGSRPASAASPQARDSAARPDFTVAGRFPVFRAPGQDTHAQDPSSRCDPATFRRNRAVGRAAVAGFAFAGADASARLLAHFLQGTGTPVNFGADTAIARQAKASSAFRTMNRSVQAEVLRQLRAGRTRVQLDRTLLQPIRFGVPGSARDLYLGFRGTQGLEVRGSGHLAPHRFTGRLTYVIRDVYGFPPSDRLLGTGPAMRYLQVNCGAPEHAGGAHWFPDSITVTVPFRRPSHQER
jgi:hypothetical protein